MRSSISNLAYMISFVHNSHLQITSGTDLNHIFQPLKSLELDEMYKNRAEHQDLEPQTFTVPSDGGIN